jgi:hypothetical protein
MLTKIVIFMVDSYPNHCGLFIPNLGLYDNSFLGTRCITKIDSKFPKGSMKKYDIEVPEISKVIDFFSKLNFLPREIIQMEKKQRGWHLTKRAPDYVLKMRKSRSKSTNSLNCVEWILLGLEMGGLPLPDYILTPNQLMEWCEQNLNQSLPPIFDENI